MRYEMSTIKCSNCTSVLPDSASFCPQCGAKQEKLSAVTSNSDELTAENKKKQMRVMLAGLAVIFIVAIVSIVAIASNNDFEKALNPYTGSRAQYNSWSDKGGLDKVKKFYGVDVEQIHSSYFLNGGPLANAQFWTFASAQDMRKALSKACKVNDHQFNRIDVNRGEVIVNLPDRTLTCYYEANTSPNGNSMLILAKKK